MVSALMLASFSACNETYTPKPRGFFRITFPKHEYRKYDAGDCPYSFEIPVYANVSAYHDSTSQPCWKYILFPRFNAEIFLSYLPVKGGDAQQYFEDARTLAYKHAVKADAIDETILHAGPGVTGMIYDIGGAAASSVQFFVTDSTRNFIRGALYFNVPPQPDSLAPVVAFLRSDIERMMLTTTWK